VVSKPADSLLVHPFGLTTHLRSTVRSEISIVSPDWPIALSCRSAGLFVRQEKRAPESIISFTLWTRRLIATSNAATLLAGMALIGLTTILPIYVQGVLGRSPIEAGATLTTLVFGWPLAIMMSGRLYKALGIRQTVRAGVCSFRSVRSSYCS
jgi:hypothetical protein